jgi:hypothetical protein
MVVELLRVPEVPVTMTEYVPGVAVLPEVSTSELALLVVAVAGLNAAVTPVGSPLTVKLTLPPKPFCPLTLRVLLPLPP